MENMKVKIKKHIENYYAKCERIRAEYAEYETKEARNYYAPVLIQEKLTEKITKLKYARLELEKNMDNEFLAFVDSIKPNNTIINSIEYQTKLSNLFNLLNLDANLDQSYLDFMIESNDYTTLELLKEKYKSKALHIAFDKVDKEKKIASARVQLQILKSYIGNDKNFDMKESILKTIYQ